VISWLVWLSLCGYDIYGEVGLLLGLLCRVMMLWMLVLVYCLIILCRLVMDVEMYVRCVIGVSVVLWVICLVMCMVWLCVVLFVL